MTDGAQKKGERMTKQLILERKGRVLAATNNDPATRNALSGEFYDGFREAVEAASADPEIGAIVLTGAAGCFSSGGHVNGLKAVSYTHLTLPTKGRG